MATTTEQKQVEKGHRVKVEPAFLGGHAAVCSCGWRSRSRAWKEQAESEGTAGQIEYAVETRSVLHPEAEDDAAFLRKLAQHHVPTKGQGER